MQPPQQQQQQQRAPMNTGQGQPGQVPPGQRQMQMQQQFGQAAPRPASGAGMAPRPAMPQGPGQGPGFPQQNRGMPQPVNPRMNPQMNQQQQQPLANQMQNMSLGSQGQPRPGQPMARPQAQQQQRPQSMPQGQPQGFPQSQPRPMGGMNQGVPSQQNMRPASAVQGGMNGSFQAPPSRPQQQQQQQQQQQPFSGDNQTARMRPPTGQQMGGPLAQQGTTQFQGQPQQANRGTPPQFSARPPAPGGQMQQGPPGGQFRNSPQSGPGQPGAPRPFQSGGQPQMMGRGPSQPRAGPPAPGGMQMARGPMNPQQNMQQQQQQSQRGGPPGQMNGGPRPSVPQPNPQQTMQMNSNTSGKPQGGNRRIDPNHMPRPKHKKVPVTFSTRQSLVQGKRLTPSATDAFVAVDDGNCNPRFMRMTLAQYPSSSSLLNQCKIPLGCVIQPYCSPGEGEEQIPVVDTSEQGPVRCQRCRGYVNVFCQFEHSAGWWKCNLCTFENPLPPQYQGNYNSMYGSSAQPELARGSVDFVVSGGYVSRPIQEPIYLFAIDVSAAAVQAGTCLVVLQSLLKLVKGHLSGERPLEGQDKARMGIVTFSEAVRFYDLYSLNDNGHKTLIVSDFEEGFCPLPPNRLCVNVKESGQELVALLEALIEEARQPALQQQAQAQLNQQKQANASIAGTAFQAAVNGLEPCGGKLCLFLSQPPTHGPGAPGKRKETPTVYATEHEEAMFAVTSDVERDPVFGLLSKKCCEKQICVDLFAFGDDHKDLTLWSVPSNNTGGTVHRFPSVRSHDPSTTAAFEAVLEHTVRRQIALEAVLKVRVSSGLRVVEYLGNGLKRTPGGELDMAQVSQDNTCAVVLEHDGSGGLVEKREVYLQCALLYSNSQGQRRVRVHNLACSVTADISEIFRNADVDAVANLMARRAASKLLAGHKLPAVHAELNATTVDILVAYRKYCAKNPNVQQLILPEALKMLPVYILAHTKSPALRKNPDSLKAQKSPTQTLIVRADHRSAAINWLMRASLEFHTKWVYPIVYSIAVDENVSAFLEKGNLAPSTFSLKEGDPSAIFLSNGMEAMIVLTPFTDAAIYAQFGLRDHSHALQVDSDPSKRIALTAPLGSTPFVLALERMIRSETSLPMASSEVLMRDLKVIVRNSAAEVAFINKLVEDSQFGAKTMLPYDDFLCQCHSSVQAKVRNS